MTPIEIKNYDDKVDTLVKYGPTFQYKAIASILQAPDLLASYFDIINPNYFEADGNKWIVNRTLEYFSKYRKLPTLEYFKIELSREKDDTLRVEVVDKLKNVHQRLKDTDLEYIRDSLLGFARNQTLKTAILDSVDYLKEERYDEIKRSVDKALRAGQPKNVGHDWKLDYERRLSQAARNTIGTGWGIVDIITNGGLAGGELGVVVAPSGAGKSWMLSTLGANAMRAGKKIIHYSLELNEEYVGIRYDTIFTGIEPAEVPSNKESVLKAISEITGESKIMFYPAKSANCNTISAHLQQLLSMEYVPDLVLVDYADLLRSTERSNSKYEELGYIYEQLRGVAGEYNLPIWTASQSQRSSIQDDVIQADKIAESYSKIMTADFVLSLSRKLEDKVSNTGRVHIIKNRFGPDGQTYPVHMNPAIGSIEIYDETSSEGALLKNKMMNSDKEYKKDLFNKYLELQGGEPD